MPAFWVKLSTNDLKSVDVLLNPTHCLLKLSILSPYACHCQCTYLTAGVFTFPVCGRVHNGVG